VSWESGDEPDEYTRQGQTGPMPTWGGPDPSGYPRQDQVPPGYGYGDAPPPGYTAPQYMPPGYVMPGHVPAPGWMPGYIVMPGPLPSSHLARSLVGLLFCWPLAIAAIIQATQVENRYSRGDYYGSLRASRNAKICANIALGIGILFVGMAVLAFTLVAGDPATPMPVPPNGMGSGGLGSAVLAVL
jgi:hypothetical protein